MNEGQIILPGLTNIVNNSENVISKGAVTDKTQKSNKAEEWEIELIGKFLFEEYRNMVFGLRTDWLAQKGVLRLRFSKYLQIEGNEMRQRFMDACGTCDVGTLLSRSNYLINTKRGCDFFRIKNSSLFQYINKKIEELDVKRKNGEATEYMANGETDKTALNGDPALIDSQQVDDNAPTHDLLYEGSLQQEREFNFQLTNMGCYICQLNFISPTDFEEHVEDHGDESDFKLLKDFVKRDSPILKLSYNVCKNSHYFRFNLKSHRPNIVIEKLVIVQSRTFYYVHNTRVPYSLGAECKDHFFVDSHMFRKGVVQPIVVVFYDLINKQKRYVEQHHFCRVEEFPVVHFSINPCRLPNKTKFKPLFKLPLYMPPEEIRRALQTDFIEAPLSELSNEFKDYLTNNKMLTQQNIREVLLKLIQIEDWDIMREYSSLVQRNVILRKYENDYIIKPKTPKHIRFENIVLPFDEVILLPSDEGNIIPNTLEDLMNKMEQLVEQPGGHKCSDQKKTKKYIGQIECISYGRVTFKCDKKIPDNKTYTILFRPSRMVLRYQYRALEQLVAMPPKILQTFLFPESVMMRELPVLRLDLFNKSIYSNPEQLLAVQCVVNNMVEKTAPYIIFGPPGTGKTTTLVEAILQIFTLQPQSRILITAGSNGACDEIALRLCKILAPMNETQTITRIYSRSYENRSENINELLLEYSNLYAEHFLPDIKVLHSYRIIVCTLSIVGRLATGKFGQEKDGSGVFTHVFVDEAAASTEAETLVGIMATLSLRASLVISGDHLQLGPLLNSQRAANMGLEKSLMERLLERDCYRVDAAGNYNQQIQMRLCRNFRSHPKIVSLYSDMYYDGQLKAKANPAVQQMCRNWYRSPNAEYPIIFHSVFGPEQRENNSKSRYNLLEITTVMDYVRDLLYFGIKGHKITQSDIGIISPYKKQYMRIQEELNIRNWYQVETGAVESFQGKEKTIIIVSFVRSFSKTLGFLENSKRLNVTLSRAKSLLILIGNPKTLSMNEEFKHIFEQCQEHKTLVGAAYYDDDVNSASSAQKGTTGNDHIQRLAKSIEKLNVSNDNNNGNNTNSGPINRTNKNKWKNKGKKNDGAAQANKSSTADGDALKSIKSQTFKTAKPKSTEKQRQTFSLYKDLYLTDKTCTTNNINNTTNGKSQLDNLLEALPRVPQQQRRQQQQHSKPHDFEVINHSHCSSSIVDQDFEHIRKRLNQQQNKLTTFKQTIEAARNIATKNAIAENLTKNQLPATAATNVNSGYKSLNLLSINGRSTREVSGHIESPSTSANRTRTRSPQTYGSGPNSFIEHVTPESSVFSAGTSNVRATQSSQIYAGEHFRRSENIRPTNVASAYSPQVNARPTIGYTEYPTPSRYMFTRSESPPKPKPKKSSCVIA